MPWPWVAGVGAAVGAVVSVTVLLASPGELPPQTRAPSSASPPPCARIVSDVYRGSDGRTHASPAPDRARVTTYADGHGTRWDEVRPPAGWDPISASDAELAAFGVNPRPAAGPEREQWEKAFAGYRGVEPGEPAAQSCRGPLKFGAPY